MTIHTQDGLAVQVSESTLTERLALIQERAKLQRLASDWRGARWAAAYLERIRAIDARLAGTEAK